MKLKVTGISEKKQPRQRRRYVGKKDPGTGEIITPRKSKQLPRLSRDFGHVYLLKYSKTDRTAGGSSGGVWSRSRLLKDIGRQEALRESFLEIGFAGRRI